MKKPLPAGDSVIGKAVAPGIEVVAEGALDLAGRRVADLEVERVGRHRVTRAVGQAAERAEPVEARLERVRADREADGARARLRDTLGVRA